MDSRTKYQDLGIPTATKKAFSKQPRFTAWGTEVDSKSGRVGTPMIKLRHLADIINNACALPRVTKKLMQGLTGLLVHPFLHRRSAMCVLQDTYVFINKLGDKESKRLPDSVR